MAHHPEPATSPAHIVLIAGPVKPHGRTGHHDYDAGCRLLAVLLSRVNGVKTQVVSGGWPSDASILKDAAALVFYDKGGGKQGFLATPERIACLERAAAAGTGMVLIHQTAGFPGEHIDLGKRLFGGVYATGASRRGHWKSEHRDFPDHPITRGVESWNIRDGWLNGIAFTEGMRGITPLVWSGKRCAGSAQGGRDDIVSWAYERPDAGRSFVFTGVDAHSAWSHAGLRRLIVSGILWSAGVEIPETGAPVHADSAMLQSFLTPRRSRWSRLPRKVWNRLAGPPRW